MQTTINWISINDRLPEDCKNILFIHDNKIKTGYLVEHFDYDNDDFNYDKMTYSFYSNEWKCEDVLYWAENEINENDLKTNNDWISFEEITPEEHKKVMVRTDKNVIDIGKWDAEEGWMFSEDDDYFEFNVVTYWKELK